MTQDAEPKRLGGWLLTFLIVHVLFMSLVAIAPVLYGLRVPAAVRIAMGPMWWWAVTMDGITSLGRWLPTLYLVRRMIRDRRWISVRWMVAGLWLFGPAWQLFMGLMVLLLAGSVPRLSGVAYLCVYACIWTPYLLVSRRVAATYPREAPAAELADIFD